MPDLSRHDLAALARDAGLTVTGVTTPEPFDGDREYIADHIQRGHTGGMDWFTTQRAAESADPRTLHTTVQSIVSVGVPFWAGRHEPPDDGVLRGRIARYAWGRDYHRVLRRRMERLVESIETAVGRPVEARTLADTARAFDRAIARRSGAGWTGKNSMVIVPGHGSWVMLGELYLDIDLVPDLPLNRNCGRCAICIDRCPTGAIIEPYRIDAPRCISYLTIEERGPIDRALRPLTGDWVFGCDVCQEVCPYTQAAQPVDDADFAPATVENVFPSLELLATMDHDTYVAHFAGTAVTRAKRRGLARNAAVALGNSSNARAEPILVDMLAGHDEPLARGHAAWGLARLLGANACPVLERHQRTELDAYVRDEIHFALAEMLA